MVQALPEPPKRRTPNLILHCGAHAVELDEVQKVNTPRSTETWTPIPHHQLIQRVQTALNASRLTIGTQAHSLSHDGQRYFGLMEIRNHRQTDDYSLVLGLRNSHDKSFPAGIVAGAQVFVCDNLSFSGEVKFARKHTRFINRDLPQIVERAIGQLGTLWHQQDNRIGAYKDAEITDVAAHDLLVRAIDVGVCANSYIPKVLKEWREPAHEEFHQRTMWSFFNAFTAALKEGNLMELPKRTEALHGLLDSQVGLN
jgi:hypothetical protein